MTGALLIAGLSVAAVTMADGWDGWAKRRQIYSLRDRAFLADASQLTNEHKSWMYPDPAMIDKQRPYLLSKRLTVFRKRPQVPTGLAPGGVGASTTGVPSTTAAPTIPPNQAPQPSVKP